MENSSAQSRAWNREKLERSLRVPHPGTKFTFFLQQPVAGCLTLSKPAVLRRARSRSARHLSRDVHGSGALDHSKHDPRGARQRHKPNTALRRESRGDDNGLTAMVSVLGKRGWIIPAFFILRQIQPGLAGVTLESASGPTPLVVNVEFESWIRRKYLRHLAQTLGHGGRRQQRIIALPQIVVVHIQTE